VPIEEIAEALDIVEVRIAEFDGFEGMLLTDTVRREGAILANARGGPRRARFTIAHELGHLPAGAACSQ
jgi:Zn-dependent peptidase ImmA (M78 family)